MSFHSLPSRMKRERRRRSIRRGEIEHYLRRMKRWEGNGKGIGERVIGKLKSLLDNQFKIQNGEILFSIYIMDLLIEIMIKSAR